MAVNPSEFPLTRDQVHEWLNDFSGKLSDLRPYLHEKVDALDLDNELVASPAGPIHIVDIIVSDLGSYV